VEPDGATPPVELTPASLALGVPIDGFAIASGARAVFLSASVYPAYELYSAPLDGSAAAIRLHPPLVAGGNVYSFVLDAEGGRALYRAEQDFDNVSELFVVPVDGSTAPALRSSIREHPSTVGDVTGFVLSPDGSTAVYQADQASGNGAYVVNLDGSPQPVWFGTSGVGKFTPDSQRIIFSSSIGLVSRPVDLSAGPTLITNLARLTDLWIAPDGSRVVHLHLDAGSAENERLFSTPVLGGPSVELNTPNLVSGEVSEPEISPDSSRVVYAGIQDAPGSIELYSVPLVGGAAPVKLNGPLVAGGDVVSSVFSERPRISPDSSRVVYLADQNINNAVELFSVPIAGGVPPTELSALSAADRDVTVEAISPDSTRVVYVADQDANDVYELYSVPIAGGVPTELSAISAPDRDVESDPLTGSLYSAFLISPDSSWVVYVADQDANDVFEVYRVPLAGGAAPVRMTFDGTTSTTTYLIAITPDSQRVVFLRDQPSGLDYYSAPLGGGSPVQLNGSLLVTGENFEPIDPSGRWLAFQAAPHLAGVNELYVVPIRGGSAPVRVNAPLAGGGPTSIYGFFRPGGNGMVYRAEQDEAGTIELYLNDLVSPRDDHHRPR
jgi:Tol biopolymer transport system component